MLHFNHLKTFDSFKINEYSNSSLTYTPNGEHKWDEKDSIISLYYFRLMQKNLYGGKVDDYSLGKDLFDDLRLTSVELAEDIIGCTDYALKVNAQVFDYLITGTDVGKKHPNIHQIKLSDTMKDYPIEKLRELSINIINNIMDDSKRLSENEEAKKLREGSTEYRKKTKSYNTWRKSEEERKELDKNRKLMSKGVRNPSKATSENELNDEPIEIGTEVDIPGRGKGVVEESHTDYTSIRFSDDKYDFFGTGWVKKFII